MKKLLLLLLLLSQLTYAQEDESNITLLGGHSDYVTSAAYSPDGKTALSGSYDNTLKLWDIATGSCLKTFLGHSNGVTSVAFSPDGNTALSGSRDNTLKLWDISTGQCLKTLSGHYSFIHSVAFSPDGKTALSGSYDKTLRLWDIATGTCLKTLSGHSDAVNSVAFSPDGKTALSGSSDNTLKLWDVATGQCLKTLSGHSRNVQSVAFSPDGKTALSGSADNTLKLWDITTAQCLKTLSGHSRAVYPLAFSPDGKIALSGSDDQTLKLWDIATGTCLKTLSGYTIAFSPDQKTALVANYLLKREIYLLYIIPLSIEDKIKLYVESKINLWQTKGEFEKTADFQKRVNEDSRKLKVDELTRLCVDSLKKIEGEKITKLEFDLSQYDPDNETYLIENFKLGKLTLPVPVADAPGVKADWASARVVEPDFYIDNGEFKLSKFSISCNGETYTYDSKIPSNYATSNITYNFEPIDVVVPQDKVVKASSNITTGQSVSVGSVDVDTNIPATAIANPHKYALIIGNEDYSTFQTDLGTEINVDFAVNDAEVFKKYCIQTLGVPTAQVKLLKNATAAQIKQGLSWINNLAKIENGDAEIIFYYSGHGLPDDATKDAYLMPVDVSGANVQDGIKLDDVYSKLTEYPTQKTIVLLDACFSGGARNQGLVAMKGSKLKPRDNSLSGNMVVLASSTGEESSGVYRSNKHGFFTYFLLKKLQETKGDITLADLLADVKQKVQKQSTLESRPQTPGINYSPAVNSVWENWKLK
jgi:hypothetical protein